MYEKIFLKTNIYFNIFKLVLFLALLLFASKLRFEFGGGWMVDTILILFCILVAFLYVISYTASFNVGRQEFTVTVSRNMLGSKLVRVKVSGRTAQYRFTTAKENTLTGLIDNVNIHVGGLDDDHIWVTLVIV